MMRFVSKSKKGKMAGSQIPNITTEIDSQIVTNSDAQLP